MFDHLGINVSDFPRSRAFYLAALAPLGISLFKGTPDWALIGKDGKLLWIGAAGPVQKDFHMAFTAASRAEVDAFHKAALAAGGTDHGAPGLRPHYGPHYYAAFVLDPDGYNLEAVCHHAKA